MAKAGFWLRGARGKLAGASVGKGSQGGTVIREVVTPRNPKTLAQTVQRVLWNTVVQAYSFFKPLADHSFEGYEPGSQTQQQFVSRNLSILRSRLKEHTEGNKSLNSFFNVTPLGDTRIARNSYILSMGTLPEVVASFNSGMTAMQIPVASNTYAGVADSLGLKRGDQLTFVSVALTAAGIPVLSYSRVILDPMVGGNEAPFESVFVNGNAIVNPSTRNEGGFSAISFEGGNLVVNNIAATNTLIGGCVIASRRDGNSWMRSTAHISFDPLDEVSMLQAVELAQSGLNADSNLYLNNAGSGNAISGTATYEPTISKLSIDGKNVLSQGATIQANSAADLTLAFTASNMTATAETPRLIFVRGTAVPAEGTTATGTYGVTISDGNASETIGKNRLPAEQVKLRLVLVDAASATATSGNVIAVYGVVDWDGTFM